MLVPKMRTVTKLSYSRNSMFETADEMNTFFSLADMNVEFILNSKICYDSQRQKTYQRQVKRRYFL